MNVGPATSRRHQGRWILRGALAAAVSIFWSGCTGKEEELPKIEPGDLKLKLGMGEPVASGEWDTLVIEVKNTGGHFRGTLEVTTVLADGSGGRLAYQGEIELPGNSPTAQRLVVPVWTEGLAAVRVTFAQSGFSRSMELGLGPDGGPAVESRFLVVTRTPTDNRQLGRILAARFHAVAGRKRSKSAPGEDDSSPAPELELVSVQPEELLGQRAAYERFDLVVLLGTALEGAPAGAPGALRSWVESGGSLLAFAGPEWAAGLGEELRDLLGVRPGSGAPLSPRIAAELGEAAGKCGYTDLVALGGTEVTPWLAHRSRRGLGHVLVLPYLPRGPFPSAAESPLLARLVGSARRAAPATRAPFQVEASARGALRQSASFQTPPRSRILVGVAFYLGLGFVAPWVIFRLLGRPQWTYGVIVAAALLASWLVYQEGFASMLSGPEIEEITIIRVAPDGKHAEATSFVGVLSPVPTSIEIDSRPPGSPGLLERALVRPLVEEGLSFGNSDPWYVPGSETQTLQVSRSGRLSLDQLRLRPNELKFLRYDYELPLTELPPPSARSVRRLARRAQEVASALEAALRALSGGGVEDTAEIETFEQSTFPGAPGVQQRNSMTCVIRARARPLSPEEK